MTSPNNPISTATDARKGSPLDELETTARLPGCHSRGPAESAITGVSDRPHKAVEGWSASPCVAVVAYSSIVGEGVVLQGIRNVGFGGCNGQASVHGKVHEARHTATATLYCSCLMRFKRV